MVPEVVVDWDRLQSFLDDEPPGGNNTNCQASNESVHRGYTGNMCTFRGTGRHNGVAQPILKPGSTDNAMVAFFVAASIFARSVVVQWLSGMEELFVDQTHPHCHSEFAGAINTLNLLETLPLHWTSFQFPLGTHFDRQNPVQLSLAAVLRLNKIWRREENLFALA